MLIADLRQSTPVLPDGQLDPQIRRLLDRFLPVAIDPPFNHREFAMQYAAILFTEKKWDQAIKYYQLVPDTEDPTRLLTARYGQLVAIKNLVEESPNLSQDKKLAFTDQIQTLAAQIKDVANKLIQSSTSDTQKQQAKSTLAHMSLVAADITRRQQNDPQKVLDLLNGFEDSVQGLPDAKSLLNGALFLRVQAYMQLGRNNDATSTLVKFLDSTGQNEGAQTVHDLLETLNTDLDHARAAGDTNLMRQLAANRAMLSGFLVKWAQSSTEAAHSRLRLHLFPLRRRHQTPRRGPGIRSHPTPA